MEDEECFATVMAMWVSLCFHLSLLIIWYGADRLQVSSSVEGRHTDTNNQAFPMPRPIPFHFLNNEQILWHVAFCEKACIWSTVQGTPHLYGIRIFLSVFKKARLRTRSWNSCVSINVPTSYFCNTYYLRNVPLCYSFPHLHKTFNSYYIP
jgi:hypothetical protein